MKEMILITMLGIVAMYAVAQTPAPVPAVNGACGPISSSSPSSANFASYYQGTNYLGPVKPDSSAGPVTTLKVPLANWRLFQLQNGNYMILNANGSMIVGWNTDDKTIPKGAVFAKSTVRPIVSTLTYQQAQLCLPGLPTQAIPKSLPNAIPPNPAAATPSSSVAK